MSGNLARVETRIGGFTRWDIALPVSGPAIQLRYTALNQQETSLPTGMQPTALLQDATGTHTIGGVVECVGGEVAATVNASIEFVQAVAQAIPLDEEDERLVDALIARKTATATKRPLRRKG